MNIGRHKWLFSALLALIMLLVLPLETIADSVAMPRDYTKETENGEYVFVMLAPEQWAKYGNPEIRRMYKQSGLYRNDGSKSPLWSVYWYSFAVYPSSDGRHIVRMGPWASDVEQLAVAFYEDGKELKAYSIKDLVRDESKLGHTVSHFFWQSSLRYDDKQRFLFLKTMDGQSYRFSVQTGKVEPEADEEKDSGTKITGKGPSKPEKMEERTILDEPVQVFARIVKVHAPTRGAGGSCEVDLTVLKGKVSFTKRTDLIGVNNTDEAFEAIKRGTQWNGKYLFVRTECGGGNTWRCNRDAVFIVKGDLLQSLGDVFAGDREKPARSNRDGYFWDLYDKFEMNGLTSHAAAPAFRLALKERNGKLKADLTRTWLQNQGDFRRRMREIDVIIKEGRTKDAQIQELEDRILANTVLARYCDRKGEVEKLEEIAQAYLEASRLKIFHNIVSHVDPGEYPVSSAEE